MAQIVKNLPVMQEIWVQSLDPEIPLEKDTWAEESGGLQSIVSQRDRHD